MPAVESNVGGAWVAVQPAKGTPNTVAQKRAIWSGGPMNTVRTDGKEDWSDTTRFGSATDFINQLIGTGAPAIEGQSNIVAFLCWAFFGAEVFTVKAAGVTPPKFVFTPGTNVGFWTTWWKRLGLSTVIREKYNDCRITSLRLEGSTANKTVKITPTWTSLDPGEIFTTDPIAALDTGNPFIYTEGEGAFVIDGTVYRGQSQFAIVIDDASAPHFTDSALAWDLIPGRAVVRLEGITIALDDVETARFRTQVYGTPTPGAGAKPIKVDASIGSYTATLTKPGNGTDTRESLKLEVPGVRWVPETHADLNPAGGLIEHALGAEARAVAGQPRVRVTVETGAGDNAAHVAGT